VRLPDRVLEPVERISEILFGLIMALTITGAVSVATSDHFQIRTMLWAALGCNLAWGIIDGGMYLMGRLGERGRNAVVARAVREASNREDAHRIIADELPPLLGSIFQPAQLEFIRERINQMPAFDLRSGLTGRDWLGAFGVCILVVLSTFPVVIPYCLRRCQTGVAHFQRISGRIVIYLRLTFCTSCWTLAMDNRRDHGCHRCCTRECCNSARRVTLAASP
jgi:hypothetical protein